MSQRSVKWARRAGAAGRFRVAVGALASFACSLGCSSSSEDGSGNAEPAPEPEGGTFVLVHGAWMGAWSWEDVADRLRAQNAKVEVVELPAHGADTTPVSDATLDAYVAKVSAAVDAAAEPVVLVGHSMAGVVITQTGENKPDQIDKLVYLAAYVPKDGDTLLSLSGADAGSQVGAVIHVDMTKGIASIPAEHLEQVFCGDCTTAAVTELKANYRDEPVVPFTSPVHVSDDNWGRLPKAYIYTEQDNAISFAFQQAMTQDLALSATATLETSHAPFLSRPDAVVTALREVE
jgi:pimeloyl-ACP methyl ester carboxylesterase